MPIKTIVFDLGKVLLDFDYGIAAERFRQTCNLHLDEMRTLLSGPSLLYPYETGLMTTVEFFDKMCTATGYAGTLDEFSSLFCDIFTPIEPMVELQAKLRAHGYPTYIFSNTNDMAIAHIRRNFSFFANFDGYILSYEHGTMKPDQKLYEVVEKQTGEKGDAILYLDDRPENIEAGAARGWQTILQETPEKTISQIGELGLLDQAPQSH
jgi:FMN phosphatase YigB (HAD superfamily)